MSNIKSKKFYKEAEDMQDGWGKYLKSIDVLKDKVDDKKDISLSDACWVLYGEGWCSFYWDGFREFCIKHKWDKKFMPWEAWNGIYDNIFVKTLK